MMRLMKRGFYLSIAFVVLAAYSVSAQEITGSIFGVVKDTNDGVVAGAKVSIADEAKGNLVIRTVTTNSDGSYSVPNLPVGIYRITVESDGFKKAIQTGVKLDVGARRTVESILEAGNILEEVTVEADPVAVDLVSATSGTIINGDQVREIPINNRNFTQLVTLSPGVTNDLSDQVYTGTSGPDGNANTVQISVNGARSSQNTFTVDGADITDRGSNLTIQAYPSVDSIGEFRVLRSLYPAESGRSGGGQVNVVTRSGSKNFHGGAYEFVRNEAFNANDFLTNQLGTYGYDANGKAKRRPFRYNDYGWTLGGPVYFLNFGEVDPDAPYFKRYEKTFFFFSQEFRKDKRYVTLTSTAPTAALKNGIFPVNICLQASGTACTKILPAGTALSTLATVNPISAQYISEIYNNIPEPTNAATYELAYPALSETKFQQEVIKIDHNFSKSVTANYRFQHDKIPSIDPAGLFAAGAGRFPEVSRTSTNSPGTTHTAQVNWVATPNVIVEGRFTYGYGAILSQNDGLLALSNSPIRPAMAFQTASDRVPSLSGNGFTALAGFGPYDNFSYKVNYSGAVTWIAGNHTMKFGAIVSNYRKNENAITGSNEGSYSTFNTPGATTRINAPGVTGTTNNNLQLWANFLLGTNATFTQASADYTADLRQKAYEAYAQDEYRILSNLTLYYGVRYSYFGSPWDKNGRLNNFVPSLWQASRAPSVTGAGVRVSGTGNFCNGLIYNAQNLPPAYADCTPTASPWGKYVVDVNKTDFAPRVGLAWDPFKKGRTAIRTGYGMYHEQVLNGIYLWLIGLNSTYLQNYTLSGIALNTPVPAGTNVNAVSGSAPGLLRGIQPDFDTPYMQHWSLDVQHQLGDNTIVTVGYYGSKGTHLIGAYEENDLRPGYAIGLGATGCAQGSSYLGQTGAVLGPCQVAGSAFTSSTQSFILDQIRPYKGYRSINMYETRYNSNYHSLQISGQHRFSFGAQINAAYTWAKNLTDNQTDRSTGPQDSYNIKAEYGRASLDRRHVFSTNWVYELPFYKDQQGFVGKMLGGWQLSGIASYNTGLPFTVTTSSYDPAGLGTLPAILVGTRPNILCDPNVGGARTQQQWFNTACFELNPTVTTTGVSNTVGTSGRGIVNGPPTARFDLSTAKTFAWKLSDSHRLTVQLRAEAFNLFNHTNFRGFSSTNVTSTVFGRIGSVRDPRTIQFGIKVNF